MKRTISFSVEQRIKEVGIRKALGILIFQIVLLLSKDYLNLILLAIIIGSPVAWWLTNNWLQDFAYRINLSSWAFVVACVLTFLMAALALSFKITRAALGKPAVALRTE
jgi:putative ABC transport system permease protein